MNRFLALLLALLLLAGPVAGLQLAAWGGMFLARVGSTQSVGEALASAVDGTRPCAVCRVAEALRHDGAPTAAMLKTLASVDLAEPVVVAWLPVAPALTRLSTVVAERMAGRLPPDLDPPPPRG